MTYAITYLAVIFALAVFYIFLKPSTFRKMYIDPQDRNLNIFATAFCLILVLIFSGSIVLHSMLT